MMWHDLEKDRKKTKQKPDILEAHRSRTGLKINSSITMHDDKDKALNEEYNFKVDGRDLDEMQKLVYLVATAAADTTVKLKKT